MTDAPPKSDESIDVRLLARQDLPHEAFPGGRNEGFRVYFSPEVHAALWKHAEEDTSVEICGVVVGSWHRDETGPFVKVVASIRGEGAEARFAEVTFTHQTWSKINAEMDSKYANLAIVGWYHTHPDFGIFLSDRDRFIHEHFFSGPGQIAHVIDPIRQLEGIFVWRDAKPVMAPHFWVGDRVAVAASGGSDGALGMSGHIRDPHLPSQKMGSLPAGAPNESQEARPSRQSGLIPGVSRLIIYGGVFLLGYLIANILSAWENQRFVANVLASNSFVAVLRLGLADELDLLKSELAAAARRLEAVRSNGEKPDNSLALARDKLAAAALRVSAIKNRYGNTPDEDELLRRFFRDKLTAPSEPTSQQSFPPVGADAKSTRDTPQPASTEPKARAKPKPSN